MRAIRWFHRIDLADGIQTPGECPHTAAEATGRFGIPEDLSGKTVLDIGAWDGLFSFEAERRGARVTAIDTGFTFAHRRLNSRVELHPLSPYDLDPARHGKFDYVFFFGVLYHLTNPIEALHRVAAVTRERCLIETAYCDHPDGLKLGFWEFAHGRENDTTNYWYPTMRGLGNALQFVGFKEANVIFAQHGRMTVEAGFRTNSLF
jgi:tRNA (mo5U34)-methyltransferase